MGLWGQFTTKFRGSPRAPGAREYQGDAYYGDKGRGTEINQSVNEAAFRNLMRYLDREPGYTEAEQEAMYAPVAEQTKFEEQGALRRLNQGGAASGRFGSGGLSAGRGDIMSSGMRARAGARTSVRVAAAEAAMRDRIGQLDAANAFYNPRASLRANEVAGRNAFNQSLNQFDLAKWRSQLDQYNYDSQMDENRARIGASAVLGLMGA